MFFGRAHELYAALAYNARGSNDVDALFFLILFWLLGYTRAWVLPGDLTLAHVIAHPHHARGRARVQAFLCTEIMIVKIYAEVSLE